MLLSSTGAIVGLVVFPYLPHFASDICFLDFVCVHQTDRQEDAAGHQVYWSIPRVSFRTARALEHAILTEVVVCLRISRISQAQPKRKDCDITGYDGGRCSFDLRLGTVGRCGILARALGSLRGEPWRMMLVLACAALPILASMSQTAVQKQDAEEELRSQLANFDVMDVKCSNEFDRQCIHDAITRWYGSLSAFNDYIQGPFCLEVLQLKRSQRGIEGHYFMFLLLPTSSYFLEGFLAIAMSGVPAEVAVSYFLAAVVCFNLIWIPSVVALGAYFTQHGVRVGRCRIKPSLLESLVILLLCLILLAVGLAATVAGIANGIPVAILWNIVGLVFAAVTWMKCWRV